MEWIILGKDRTENALNQAEGWIHVWAHTHLQPERECHVIVHQIDKQKANILSSNGI